jgi:hypothetical protein
VKHIGHILRIGKRCQLTNFCQRVECRAECNSRITNLTGASVITHVDIEVDAHIIKSTIQTIAESIRLRKLLEDGIQTLVWNIIRCNNIRRESERILFKQISDFVQRKIISRCHGVVDTDSIEYRLYNLVWRLTSDRPFRDMT